jgi:D-aminopeptidase
LVEISYREHFHAHVSGFFPGATQKDTTTVQFESDSYFEVMRFLLFAA